MKTIRILPLLLIIAAFAPAYGAVYECQRGDETLYTNKLGQGCRAAIKLPPIGAYSSDNRAYASRSSGSSERSSNVVRSTTRSGTSAQRVSPQVQVQRDGGRLGILQRELDNEQKALSDAARNLAVSKAAKHNAERITSLEGAVKDRRENISALQKEIARM